MRGDKLLFSFFYLDDGSLQCHVIIIIGCLAVQTCMQMHGLMYDTETLTGWLSVRLAVSIFGAHCVCRLREMAGASADVFGDFDAMYVTILIRYD